MSPIDDRIANLDLNKEWSEIENTLKQEKIPSTQKLKDYVLASSQKPNFNQQIDKVLVCIADILRLEEDQVLPTEPALKELLILLESSTQPQQIAFNLAKM